MGGRAGGWVGGWASAHAVLCMEAALFEGVLQGVGGASRQVLQGGASRGGCAGGGAGQAGQQARTPSCLYPPPLPPLPPCVHQLPSHSAQRAQPPLAQLLLLPEQLIICREQPMLLRQPCATSMPLPRPPPLYCR